MAEQSAPIDVAHPPAMLLRVLNPILRTALRTPLGARLREFMLIEFAGRKSGRPFAIPVSAHQLDGDLYVVLEAQWKYNFRDGADAVIHHLGRKAVMRGRLITDRDTVADIVHRLTASYGTKRAQRSMGMSFREDREPTVEEWRAAASRLGIAAIALSPQ